MIAFRELPVGNVFELKDDCLALKLYDNVTRDFKAVVCECYGLFGAKRLVHVLKKIEELDEDRTDRLERVAVVRWGSLVKVPHLDRRYVVTSGFSPAGVIVGALGKSVDISDGERVRDRGYAGSFIGLTEL